MIDPLLGFDIDPKSAGIPGKSEQWVQTSIVNMIRLEFPGYMFVAVKNEGKQHPGQGLRTNAAGRRKGWLDGLIPGPDGFIAVVEVKAATGNMTPEQLETARWLHMNGHRVAMVRSAESLRRLMVGWGC